jgi:stage II sporulation protein D
LAVLMRRIAPLSVALAGLLVAPAHAASTFTVRGAGWGHGVGMSQYGALGMARAGSDYREILRHYYTGTSLGTAPKGEVVRVLLQSPRVAHFSGATRAGTRKLDPAKTYRVARNLAGDLILQSPTGRKLATFTSPLQVTGEGPIRLGGTSANGLRDGTYRGWFEFRPNAFNGVLAINAIGLEQYLAGVVPAESPSSWPQEQLKAQAVAARTYAITTGGDGSSGWEQHADTRSQVYRGVAAETASTNTAINATRGQVVTHGGRPVVTYFFSTSGGRTENVEDSFLGAEPAPHLKSVADPLDKASPYHRWRVKMTMRQADARLGALVRGRFRGIRVTERGSSPRIVRAQVVGSRGSVATTGPTLRSRLGLRDTWARFTAISSRREDPDRKAPEGDPSGGTPSSARAAAVAGGVLAGRIVPVRRGAEVRVQRRVGDAWRLAAVTLAGRGGVYRTTVPGPGVYRVVGAGAVGPEVRITP